MAPYDYKADRERLEKIVSESMSVFLIQSFERLAINNFVSMLVIKIGDRDSLTRAEIAEVLTEYRTAYPLDSGEGQ